MKNLLISIFLLGGMAFLSCQEDGKNVDDDLPMESEIFIWDNTSFELEENLSTEVITERPPDRLCASNRAVEKVNRPSITPFIPQNPNGLAVIICPGGGYARLAFDKEGTLVAEWLNQLGITAFVLKYRLPEGADSSQKDFPLQDAQRAIRYIRAKAGEFQINPDKVGIMGFSAGGHAAGTLGTDFGKMVYSPEDSIDAQSARPDFMMLIYPVISMESGITHEGSRSRLLGPNPSQELIDEFSLEKRVSEKTPPAFLAHAKDDGAVIPENSIRLNEALVAAKINSTLYLYENGGHGGALCQGDEIDFSRWANDCQNWLEGLL